MPKRLAIAIDCTPRHSRTSLSQVSSLHRSRKTISVPLIALPLPHFPLDTFCTFFGFKIILTWWTAYNNVVARSFFTALTSVPYAQHLLSAYSVERNRMQAAVHYRGHNEMHKRAARRSRKYFHAYIQTGISYDR